MKRAAICLFIWVAISGWAAGGQAWAKKGGGGKAAPAPASDEPAAADDKSAAGSDQTAAPADSGQAAPAAGEAAPAGESLESEEGKPGKVEGEEEGGKPKGAATTLSWQDIVVVPRKAFLKGGRFEFAPFTGVSVNDILVRHYVFGLDLNFYLTDVLWVGLQGQYFIKVLTEREDLIGLQYNRIPTLNHYLYGGALNFGYVPVYGKFAWVNKSIMHWEIWTSAGIGVTESETIPRNPGTTPFKNTLITPNVGIGSRFFLFDWLTVNFALRDYIFADKFERVPNTTPNDPATTKANAESALVNNVMFYAGVGFYLPTKFQYKTPR
jgi:outer membrane beta-barrel protein